MFSRGKLKFAPTKKYHSFYLKEIPMTEILRQPAEVIYAHELSALKADDTSPKPTGWQLSPQAVVKYLMGGTTSDGTVISEKYVGNRKLIETAVATLATDRALLAFRVRQNHGFPSICRQAFVATVRGLSNVPQARTKTKSATAGTMPNCLPKAQAKMHLCLPRYFVPCRTVRCAD